MKTSKNIIHQILSSVVFVAVAVTAHAAPRFGGQTLILVVSDPILGVAGELAQKLPIVARPDYYHYDKIITLSGAQVRHGQLRVAAIEAFRDSRVVDVIVFSHGLDGNIILRSGKVPQYLRAWYLADDLVPLNGKFRLFYTAACDFDEGVRAIVEHAGAAVAIGHQGHNDSPLTFPLKFLRYFKIGGDDLQPMTAGDAATKAFDYFINDPNPLNEPILRLFAPSPMTYHHPARFFGSRPVIAGSLTVKGSDLDLASFKSLGKTEITTLEVRKVKLTLKDIVK